MSAPTASPPPSRPSTSSPPTRGDGPYRSSNLTPPEDKPRWPIALVAAPVAMSLFFLFINDDPTQKTVDIDDLGPPLVNTLTGFPAEAEELPRATPLEPLLAADQPESLSVLSPSAGASRLTRNQTLRFRFNRPMVQGSAVGKPLDAVPLTFDPPVSGQAEWTSRSAFVFRPDPTNWGRSREASVEVADWVRSLDGSEVFDEDERVVVFDATPRLVSTRGQRVAAGASLPLLFDNRVNPGELRNEIFAFEIGGGSRSIPISLQSGSMTERGHQIEVTPGRSLEAGARIGVAVAPRWTPWGGSSPSVIRYTIQPPPRIEGVACGERAPRSGACAYGPTPGRVVDITEVLRLQATEALAPIEPYQVQVIPSLPQREITLDESKRVISIKGEWAPDQVYEVRVGTLQTETGQQLRRTPPLAIRSAGYSPRVRVEGGHFAWESEAAPWIYFSGVNLAAGEIYYRPVAPGEEVEAALNPSRYVVQDNAVRIPLQPLAPDSRPNRWGEGRFGWQADGRNAQMAVVAFRAGPVPERGRLPNLPTLFVQRTDLAPTVRVLPEGVLVWVTSLSGAAPVNDAQVALHTSSGEVATATTGELGPGIAYLPTESSLLDTRFTVRVEKSNDRSLLLMEHGRALGPARLGLSPGAAAPEHGRPVASVFADRGAYRPGETVRVRATARHIADTQITPLRNTPLRLQLKGPSRRLPIASQRVSSNRYGSVSAEFQLPRSASLGQYRAELVRLVQPPMREGQTEPSAPREEVLGTTTLRVASFRQPTFRVDVERRRRLIAGDPLTLAVQARYLFGAPIKQGKLHWSLYRDGSATYPDQWDQFQFGPSGATVGNTTIESGHAELDDHGASSIAAATGLVAMQRQRLSFEAEVTDATGQSLSATRNLTLYPGDLEVGIRTGSNWVEAGEALSLEAIVINNDGEAVPGSLISGRVVREGWHSWWEWARGNSRSDYQLRREQQQEEVHRCELISSNEPVVCEFTPNRPGTYVLEAEVKDESGRTSRASRRLYVAGPDEAPDRDPPGAPIALTPVRRKLSVGETANLAFESPFESGRALISVEQGGLLTVWEQEVHAGGNQISFEINDRMVPNVFVGVAIVRPRVGDPGRRFDVLGPDLRFGAAELQVTPGAANYEVVINAPEAGTPGEEVEVEVLVENANGPAQTEVALWAVDEGTLRLTGYEMPDPTSGLFASEPAAFSWEDLRRRLVSRIEPPSWRAGGDGGEAESTRTIRPQDVIIEPNPLWEPHLVTDRNGRVTARFRLPERNTEYRIMAIAMDQGVGSGDAETKLTATRPIVMQDALPRFATQGDEFEAAVFVANATEETQHVNLEVRVDGEAVASLDLELEPKAQERVAHPITVGAQPSGRSAVEVAFVSDRGASVTRQISIAPAGHYRRAYAYGAVQGEPGSERNLPIALNLPQSQRGHVTVQVASHPFVGLNALSRLLTQSRWGGLRHTAASLLTVAARARTTKPNSRARSWTAIPRRTARTRSGARTAAHRFAGVQRGIWALGP